MSDADQYRQSRRRGSEDEHQQENDDHEADQEDDADGAAEKLEHGLPLFARCTSVESDAGKISGRRPGPRVRRDRRRCRM
jgi:hypothetical protein